MSWNLFWGLGAPVHKLDSIARGIQYFVSPDSLRATKAIAEVVKQHSPDILALQEVDVGSKRNARFDQVNYISNNALLEDSLYAPEKRWGKFFNDGNAILSKYQFKNYGNITLPHNLEKRNYIFSEMEIEGKRFAIINTHLGAHSFNAKERMKQVKSLAEKINSIHIPVILMGDFNCSPTGAEMSYLKKQTGLSSIIFENTYPSYKPAKSFDNILISKSIGVETAKVLDVKCSDHLPVYAKLII